MKKTLLIVVMLCLCSGVWAASVSSEQAREQARKFIASMGMNGALEPAMTQSARRRSLKLGADDYYYVFNVGQNQGFVVVSGDDRTPAVLGYSKSGSFDLDNIPSNMAAWLQGYADQIKYLQDNNIQPKGHRAIRKAHAAVADLVTSKWDQTEPYNDNMPLHLLHRTVTGCTSTALAQIMYYHKYPSGSKAIPGYTTDTHHLIVPPLPATTFDWGNMTDVYNSSSTKEQKKAVALLLEYTSKGMQADFGTQTLIWDNKIVPALTDYFGYSSSAELKYRNSNVSDSEWDNMIYYEIANGRPVLYGGQSADKSGHSFVVHGYDGNGYYAVNWGWGGYCDNYFLLDNMAPEGTGTGGGQGQYNYNQSAVIGISPTPVDKYVIQEDAVLTAYRIYVGNPSQDMKAIEKMTTTEYTGTRNADGSVYFAYNFYYASFLANTYSFRLGYGILKDGQMIGDIKEVYNEVEIAPSYYNFIYGKGDLGAGLANGNYQLKLYSKCGSDDWQQCKDPTNEYTLNLQVSDTQITMKVGPAADTPTPGPDPQPVVTDDDRAALTALYADVQKSAASKLETVTNNQAMINGIKQVISERAAALSSTSNDIKNVESKLSSEYLTEEQKSSYTTQLASLKEQQAKLATDLDEMAAKLQVLNDNAASLVATLTTLQNDANTAAAAVSQITTQEALEASKARVTELSSQLEKTDVTGNSQGINTLVEVVNGFTLSDLSASLQTISGAIDQAIADGKKAADEEAAEKEREAKEKLEAAKKTLMDDLTDVSKLLNTKLDALAGSEKLTADLLTAVTTAESAVSSVEDQVKAIRQSLKSDMLTADQKTDFEARLKTQEEKLAAYKDNVKSLQQKLDVASKAVDELKAEIQQTLKSVESLATDVNAIQTQEDLKLSQEKAETLKTSADKADVTDVEKLLNDIKSGADTLKLDDVKQNLATIADDVDKAITLSEEEYQRQQQEKLQAAQDQFTTALDDLTATIERQTGYYSQNLEVFSGLEAKLEEIKAEIAVVELNVAEIEKLIENLKETVGSRTRGAQEEIESLESSLSSLKANLTTLTANVAKLQENVDKIREQLATYKAAIDVTSEAREKIQGSAGQATTVDAFNTLAQQALQEAYNLESWGTNTANVIINNMNLTSSDFNIVINQTNQVTDAATRLLDKANKTVTAIGGITIDESDIEARYDMQGRPVDSNYRGLQVIRMNNGTTKVIFKR